MNTIGLVGGMSWESSIAYERLISQEVRRRLGGNHSADLLIRSYDFTQIQALQQPAMRRRRLAAGGWRPAALPTCSATLGRPGAVGRRHQLLVSAACGCGRPPPAPSPDRRHLRVIPGSITYRSAAAGVERHSRGG